MLLLFFSLFSHLTAYDEPVNITLFRKGDYGSNCYRIPAIVMAPDNVTLVTATDKRWHNCADLPEKIDVVIRISKDNGETWSEPKMLSPGISDPLGYGDPALVVDRVTKAVFCFFTGHKGTFESTKDDRQTNYYCVSYDNGETWSEMVEITNMLYGTGCPDPIRKEWYSNFFTSGNGHQLRSGRLMLIGATRYKETDSWGSAHVNAIYSDDHGKTWTMTPNSPLPLSGGDESNVIELNNGTLLMDIRRSPNRLFSHSYDQGLTWTKPFEANGFVDPACNGDLIRYTSVKDGYNKNRILHSHLHASSRMNLTIYVSYDEGNTWPIQKVLYSDNCIYSSTTFSPVDGTIYVYWEKGADPDELVVSKFSLEWLTDGQDTWTPPDPSQVSS